MDEAKLKNVRIRDLPHSLQELIDCIGLENAYRMTLSLGGRPKYIPKFPARSSLTTILPEEAIQALNKRYAGVSIEVPKVDHFLRQIRNQQISQESHTGLSRSALADKYGLSLRQIGNIRRLDQGQ